MVIAPAGGPNWTDILTAIGTVGAVIVAVGIALWTERRSDKRIKEERARSDLSLTEQQEQSRVAIEGERAYSRAQVEEERHMALERQQYAEAYAVQVAFGDTAPDGKVRDTSGNLVPVEVRKLAVMIVNRSPSTITRIEAQFCLGKSMITHHRFQRVASFDQVPEKLRVGYRPSPERQMSGVLTPFDVGIRFETDEIHERHLLGPYPVVRWTDRWVRGGNTNAEWCAWSPTTRPGNRNSR